MAVFVSRNESSDRLLGASGCRAFPVAAAQSTSANSMFQAFVATTTLSNRVIVPWTIPCRCNS